MPSWYKMQDNSTPRKASSGIDLRNVSFTHLSSRESHNHVLQATQSTKTRLESAAVYVGDALHGRNMAHQMDPFALSINRWLRSPLYNAIYAISLVSSLGLALYEQPSSIQAAGPRNLPTGSRTALYLMELATLIVFSIDLGLRMRFLGPKRFQNYIWGWVKLFFIIFSLCGMTANAIDPTILRIHRPLRPLMLVSHYRNVQKIFGNMMATTTKIAKVTILLVFHVVFFGILANKLFGGVPEADFGQCVDPHLTNQLCSPFAKHCKDYFGHVYGAMNQLFILLTTANFPDVMLPVYDCQPAAALFFVLFLMIGLFFIMNLILAAAYSLFQDKTREKTLETIKKRTEALDAAFDLITQPKVWSAEEVGVTEAEFTQILTRVRHDLQPWQVKVLFNSLDEDKNGMLTKSDWRELVHVAEVHIEEKDGAQGRRFDPPHVLAKVHAFVSNSIFIVTFDMLVYLNAVLVLIQASFHTDTAVYINIDRLLDGLLYAFAVELALKMSSIRVRYFFSDGLNVFDFVIIVAALCVDIYGLIVGAHTGGQSAGSSRYASQLAFLRSLRALRALRALKGFGEIVRAFTSIIPTFMRYLAVLFVVFYTFAIVGMEVFAGTMPGPTDYLSPAFMDTAYYSNQYWSVTFDTFGRAMVTLFALTIVNNWPIIMEGYVVAVATHWAMLFFYVWYFAIVVVVLNIVTAFLIDDFTVMRAQIVDDNTGYAPLWLQRIRKALITDDKGHEAWEISRPVHTINVYETMFEADIEQMLEESGLAAGDPRRLSTAQDLNLSREEKDAVDAVVEGTFGEAGEPGRFSTSEAAKHKVSAAGARGAGDAHHPDHEDHTSHVAALAHKRMHRRGSTSGSLHTPDQESRLRGSADHGSAGRTSGASR